MLSSMDFTAQLLHNSTDISSFSYILTLVAATAVNINWNKTMFVFRVFCLFVSFLRENCDLFDHKLTNSDLGIFFPNSAVLQHMLLIVINHYLPEYGRLETFKICFIAKTVFCKVHMSTSAILILLVVFLQISIISKNLVLLTFTT